MMSGELQLFQMQLFPVRGMSRGSNLFAELKKLCNDGFSNILVLNCLPKEFAKCKVGKSLLLSIKILIQKAFTFPVW